MVSMGVMAEKLIVHRRSPFFITSPKPDKCQVIALRACRSFGAWPKPISKWSAQRLIRRTEPTEYGIHRPVQSLDRVISPSFGSRADVLRQARNGEGEVDLALSEPFGGNL